MRGRDLHTHRLTQNDPGREHGTEPCTERMAMAWTDRFIPVCTLDGLWSAFYWRLYTALCSTASESTKLAHS